MGSITALSLDEVADHSALAPVALSLADWPQSGLPWIAFWIKELLTWGTLEPVAAFLLAKGLAVTRQDAELAAAAYYETFQFSHEDGDESALDPRAIRDWATTVYGTDKFTSVQLDAPETRVQVRLVRPQRIYKEKRLRVLPTMRTGDGVARWYDVAGYHVASCSESLLDSDWTLDDTDFNLDVNWVRFPICYRNPK